MPTDFYDIEDLEYWTPKALRVFIIIMNLWKVSLDIRHRLLALEENIDLEVYGKNKIKPLSDEQIFSIMLLLRIAKYLRILLKKENADRWVNKPNSNSLFQGDTALEYMCKNGHTGIKKVHQYLASQVYGGPYS